MSDIVPDAGLQRSEAAAVGAGATLLDLQNQRPSGGRQFGPDDFENDTPFFDSVASAFSSSGIITGGVRWATADPTPENTEDPNYTIAKHYDEDPEFKTFVDMALELQHDPMYSGVLEGLAEVRNAEAARHLMKQTNESRERLQVALDNGLLPYAIGTIGGIGLDIGAVALFTAGFGALPSGVAGAGRAAHAIGTFARTVDTAARARALAAGRIGVIGALEGGAERLVQSQTDPLITNDDIWEAAGMGAGAGMILGGAFPKVLGGVSVARSTDKELDAALDAAVAERRSLSAAGAEAAREVRPAKGAGSILAGKVVGTGYLAQQVLRNPKRVLTDLGVKGVKQQAEQNLRGNSTLYNIMSRVVRVGTANEDEVGGGAARIDSVQDIDNQLRDTRVAVEEMTSNNYRAMLNDVFGTGGLTARTHEFFNRGEIGPSLFNSMADELANIRMNKFEDIDVLDAFKDKLPNMDEVQRAKLRDYLTRQADIDDEFYMRFGLIEEQLGILPEGTVVPGYRPQRWNKDAIQSDPVGFKAMLTEAFARRPSDDWVRQFATEVDEETGQVTRLLGDDEGFDDLVRKNPEMADDLLAEWAQALKTNAEDALAETTALRKAELDRINQGRAEDLVSKWRSENTRDLRLHNRLNQELTTARQSPQYVAGDPAAVAAVDKLADRLLKIERRTAKRQEQLATLRNLQRTEDDLTAFIVKHSGAKLKKTVGKASRKLSAAARAEARAAARKTVKEELDTITAKIQGGDNPFGLVPDEVISGSARFKRRSIDLGRLRHTEQGRRYLDLNSDIARKSYTVSTAPQIAMRRVFGDLVSEETPAGLTGIADRIKAAALQGFDDDLTRASGSASAEAIRRERAQAERLIDGILGELTNADVLKTGGKWADAVAMNNTVMAMIHLGTVAIMQLGDMALQTMAGGRISTGLRGLFTPRTNRTVLQEAFERDPNLGVTMMGTSALDGSRLRNLAGVDMDEVFVAGGTMSRIQKTINNTNVIQGYANFMSVWNQWVRGAFGVDMARQISRDMGNWDKLPAHLKTFYARHGIDGKIANEMADMYAKHSWTTSRGGVVLPDTAAWAKAGRQDLVDRFIRTLRSAGDEALLDPGVGDRPFLRSHPAGRLVQQFQAFMFTAADRFISPMIQEMRLHPTSIRPYTAALMGITMGAIADGGKAAIRGEYDAWADNWSDEEGLKQNLWSALLRSPMMAGSSSILTEVAMSQFGRVINDRAEDLTGVRPLRESATRFKENQGMWALMGPSAGFYLGTAPTIGRKIVEGDTEAVEMIARRLPIINTLLLQTLGQVMLED